MRGQTIALGATIAGGATVADEGVRDREVNQRHAALAQRLAQRLDAQIVHLHLAHLAHPALLAVPADDEALERRERLELHHEGCEDALRRAIATDDVERA